MNNFRHLVAAPRTRRALLNDTMRALLEIRPPVTLLVYEPALMARLRAAGRLPRTLLHPALPGFKK